jgi:cell division protein FtsW (lipid II flippase)
MNLLIELLTDSGQFIRPWLSEISTAMVACLLVVFGADINRALRRQLSGTNFIIRTLVFILVNAFGYGFLIVSVSPWLAKQLSHIPSQWLICLVVTVFIFVGSWAQRNRQV